MVTRKVESILPGCVICFEFFVFQLIWSTSFTTPCYTVAHFLMFLFELSTKKIYLYLSMAKLFSIWNSKVSVLHFHLLLPVDFSCCLLQITKKSSSLQHMSIMYTHIDVCMDHVLFNAPRSMQIVFLRRKKHSTNTRFYGNM